MKLVLREGMATLSLDLRQRIISTCDRGEGTQEQVARRFGVSYGMVKSCSSSGARPAASSRDITSPDARRRSWRSTASRSASNSSASLT
ncbi:MAG: hypothetical protein IPK22_03585 [Verrucomicrobiaceae bacterium]|nr:hypothetical protein [Verrucomicrobiaceae bacterium]